MRVLLIVPAYNEEQNIQETAERILRFRPQGDYELDYLVVNDGSQDGTERICRERGFPCLSLIENLGIGGAVQSGYLYARRMDYDVAVQFDGDGQHDIGSLDALLEPLLAGEADFCIGSRFLGPKSDFRSTAARRVGIRWLSSLIALLTGVRISDPTSGFRAAARPVIEEFSQRYPVDYPEPESIVQLLKKGCAIAEVPVNMFERDAGSSSINLKESVYYMFKVSLAILVARFRKGEKK